MKFEFNPGSRVFIVNILNKKFAVDFVQLITFKQYSDFDSLRCIKHLNMIWSKNKKIEVTLTLEYSLRENWAKISEIWPPEMKNVRKGWSKVLN